MGNKENSTPSMYYEVQRELGASFRHGNDIFSTHDAHQVGYTMNRLG